MPVKVKRLAPGLRKHNLRVPIPAVITTDWLSWACDKWHERFAATFPRGMRVTRANLRRLTQGIGAGDAYTLGDYVLTGDARTDLRELSSDVQHRPNIERGRAYMNHIIKSIFAAPKKKPVKKTARAAKK